MTHHAAPAERCSGMGTTFARPWTLWGTLELRSPSGARLVAGAAVGLETATSLRIEPPRPSPRVLRQLRVQLTLERLIAAPAERLDKGRIPLDMVYVDGARWDVFDRAGGGVQDGANAQAALRQMREWLRYPLLRNVVTSPPASSSGAPSRFLRADAYLVRESLALIAFVRVRDVGAGGKVADRWVRLPVHVTAPDQLAELPERFPSSFMLRPAVEEELAALHARFPPLLAFELGNTITRICTPDGGRGRMSDFGAVAEILTALIDRFARVMTADELAAMRLYRSICRRRGEYWDYQRSAARTEQIYASRFASLAAVAVSRSSVTLADELAPLFAIMPPAFAAQLGSAYAANARTPRGRVPAAAHRAFAALLDDFVAREEAALTDGQLVAIEAHRFRSERIAAHG